MPEIKLALILPLPYLGGVLTAYKNVARLLYTGAKAKNVNLKIYMSIHSHLFDQRHLYADIENEGIIVLSYSEFFLSKETVNSILKAKLKYQGDMLTHDMYVAPCHPAVDFSSMDAWLWFSDRIPSQLAPLTKIGFMPFDFIQRYVSELFTDAMWELWRRTSLPNLQAADYVYFTTPSTRTDGIDYAGIDPNKAKLLSLEIKLPPDLPIVSKEKDYFVWTTNNTIHKNQVFTFNTLIKFYQQNPDAPPVKVIGAFTEIFNPDGPPTPHAHHNKVRESLKDSGLLDKKIFIIGFLNETQYYECLSQAKFLLHSVLNDNGTYAIIDTCYFNVPMLSSDYPAMRYFSELFSIPLTYFHKSSEADLIDKLNYMLMHADELALQLPSRDKLELLANDDIASQYWDVFNSTLLSHV